MEHTSHQKILQVIDPEMMVWVLDDTLDQASVEQLCKACALIVDGVPDRRIPKRRLVVDLAEAFYKNEKIAQRIDEALAEANRDVLRACREMSLPEISEQVADRDGLLREQRTGRLLYALANDPREEVKGAARTLFASLSEKDASAEDARRAGEVEARLKARLAEVTRTCEQLRQEVEEARERLAAVESEKRVYEEKLQGLVEERTALKRRVLDLQRDLAAAQTAQRHAEEEAAKLRQRVEHPVAADAGTSASSLNHLTRESRKIQYTLEKIEKCLDAAPRKAEGPDRFLEALSDTVMEVKSLVTREIIDNGRERNEVRRSIEDMRGEMRGLQSEMRRASELDRRPVRMPGEAERVGVFVDVQNIFYAAKQFNARLDFEKLLRTSAGNRRLIRAIAYVVQSPEVDQSGFITMLQQKSYEVKRKNLRLRSDGSAKGDWDMGMAIDIIDLAKKLDVVVLVSGDGDFVSLVNLIKTVGPKVEVYSFLHNTARDLIQAADEHFPIDDSLLLRLNGDYISARQQREAAEAARLAEVVQPPEPVRLGEVARVTELARSPEPAPVEEGKG
ncbi:MAG: hypothetical protein A3F84_04755 [Candidatus Handelsmanbacteria bacterium RIFCSPLOWO2_12_FULL_64_10]|uniref:NYN domain-containing protein n=1 Tax=Handelsmanbacteria sp. (strain RIFCSPLOWO2_12_FULL_64_10) TaxID=1817868 RepID=A0A1F6CXS4_HANXR|nr:MAG: hypothetical protein A3F84_04755 [Candidatus Handelsmanbacteria bacterium RIFCSPLOWO2_12_FULL_64_10]